MKFSDPISVTRTCNGRNTNVKRALHERVTGATRTCNGNYVQALGYIEF